MEKHTPHCKLQVVKALIAAGKIRTTGTAIIGAECMGIDRAGIIKIVMALTPSNFYKSMTTHANHKIWQDVYHTVSAENAIYLKLTVVDDVLIVSFKEL